MPLNLRRDRAVVEVTALWPDESLGLPREDVDNGVNPLCRCFHSLNIVDGKAYIWGGITSNGAMDTDMHVLTLPTAGINTISEYERIPATIRSNRAGDLLRPRAHHSALVYDNRIVIFGGQDSKGALFHDYDRLYAFDVRGKFWGWYPTHPDIFSPKRQIIPEEDVAPWPLHRMKHGVAKYGQKMIIFGGVRPVGRTEIPMRSAWTFDFRTKLWTELPFIANGQFPVPPPIAIISHRLYFIGNMCDAERKMMSLDLKIPGAQWTISTQPTVSVSGTKGCRDGAGLVSLIHTLLDGSIHHHLLYFLGHDNSQRPAEDIWSYRADSVRYGSSSGSDESPPNETQPLIYPNWRRAKWEGDGAIDIRKQEDFAYANIDSETVLVWGGTQEGKWIHHGFVLKFRGI